MSACLQYTGRAKKVTPQKKFYSSEIVAYIFSKICRICGLSPLLQSLQILLK